MRPGRKIAAALLVVFGIWTSVEAHTNVVPPRLSKRTIGRDQKLEGGPHSRQFTLRDGDVQFTLFVPEPINSPRCTLTLHFHTEPWFVIQEHVRRRTLNPLACFQLGQGSTVYRRAFEDRGRFGRCVELVEEQLREHWPAVTIQHLELSSFSAGYGAIREILKSPAYVDRISAVVLADSMYGSFDTNITSSRVPAPEHIVPWLPFATAAVSGKKTFVITYSDVPTTNYASTRQCAEALLAGLGLKQTEVTHGSLDATQDPEFPLLRRLDAGQLHVWGYGGTNAQAHLTHVRHLAEIWQAAEQSLRLRSSQ